MSKRCYLCGKIMRVITAVLDPITGRGSRNRENDPPRKCINPKCERSPYYISTEDEEE